jgi:hypothetical protein
MPLTRFGSPCMLSRGASLHSRDNRNSLLNILDQYSPSCGKRRASLDIASNLLEVTVILHLEYSTTKAHYISKAVTLESVNFGYSSTAVFDKPLLSQ